MHNGFYLSGIFFGIYGKRSEALSTSDLFLRHFIELYLLLLARFLCFLESCVSIALFKGFLFLNEEYK